MIALPASIGRGVPLFALGAAACAALALLPGDGGALAARAGLAALAVGAVAVAARRRGAGHRPPLAVTARAALDRATSLAVVQVDGRRFLVGAGGRGVELLAELEPAAAPAPGPAEGAP